VSLEIVSYSPAHEALWDAWCLDAENATLLHTRKFLGYHGKRFEDASILFFESSRLVGIMPAARALDDSQLVVSHPGATYGGIVHQGWLSGERIIEAFKLLMTHYSGMGFAKLLYKPLPHIYARIPSQDDLYALFSRGAQRVRCDLSCAVDLSVRRLPSERRRRGLRKALKSVTLAAGNDLLTGLWSVLVRNLERKHDAEPVHSLDELTILMDRFPDKILLRCATIDGSVEAGVIFFNSANVWHAQYIASSEKGYAASALDAVFESAIDEAKNSGARYFDFGTSNEEGGRLLNDGLYRFKSEFGGGGVAHEYYELII
jgi:hypothetical protein